MKKIYLFVMLALATTTTVFFTSCEKDDDKNDEKNYEKSELIIGTWILMKNKEFNPETGKSYIEDYSNETNKDKYEFTKENTIIWEDEESGEKEIVNYKIDGDKLIITYGEGEDIQTIKTLTKDKLVLEYMLHYEEEDNYGNTISSYDVISTDYYERGK